MLVEILLFLLLGIIAGTFTGLMPGIHINLVSAILISLSLGLLSSINHLFLIVFVVSMSITHTFVDFIPSVFLGCPDTDTELSILPGHELLKEGKGHAAVLLTNYGSIAAIILTIILAFPLVIIVKKVYPLLQTLIPYILILVSLIMIFSESKKISSFIVFALTGILGLITLNLEILKEPLLPLLSGLFGSSTILLSIKNKTKIPKQTKNKEKTDLKRPILGALIASPLCGFLPGLGSGQAAILGNTFAKTDRRGFLVLLGATNTLVMGFSFLSLYTIARTRTGSAAAIKELIGIPSVSVLILILTVVLITGLISFFITISLSAFFSSRINRINYTTLSICTLIILFIIVTIVSGFLGMLVFIISTFTGIYCILLGVRRTQMMACLILPTIVLYLT
jgi:putative membrane protein